MPTQAEIIKQATIRARRDFVGFSKREEAAILRLYQSASEKLAQDVYTNSRAGKVMTARRNVLLKEINDEIARLRISLNSKIKNSMSSSFDSGMAGMVQSMNAAGISGNIQIGSSFIGADGLVRRYNPKVSDLAGSRWGKINKSAMAHQLRFRPGGLTFAKSIWGANWDVQKKMLAMVNEAVLLGTSSQKLARDLVKYTTKQGIRVGKGQYKSAYKNAWRLARTEMNRAYHEGQIRYMKSKPKLIDGAIWRLGGPGPWFCVCPDLEGRFFPTEAIPPKPHPNCMCYLEYHVLGSEKPPDQGPLEARTKKAITTAA
jgi:hypothetical protein